MSRHPTLPGAVLALLVAGCGADDAPATVAGRPTVPGKPDIVLVTIDTLRADHLSCYGYFRETSPNIDALAKESLVFERCLAPMATTLPTHTSLFTGTFPLEHGVLANVIEGRLAYKRSDALVMFAEYLHELGYDTGAFVSALPLKKRFELDPGFEVYYNPRGKPAQPANETVDVVLGWLQHRGSRPLFLWLHLFDPHSPYDPPAPLDVMYRSDDALEQYVDARRFSEEATRPTGPVNVLREGINTYDGEIRFVDEQLGRVLSALRERSRWSDTVVVILADHGEGLNQHDEPGHGLVWDEQLHVPLLIRAPGVPPGRVANLMSVVDVLPTLLGLLELPDEDRFLAQASGRDVLRPDAEPLPVFSQTSARQNKFGEEYTYALTMDRWKYILTKSGEEQLFDLGADPYELENVAAANTDVTARLRDRVRATIAGQLRRAKELKSGRVEALSTEEAEGLRSLGYGGGDEDGD